MAPPGDLAVYDRSSAGAPASSWQRHVDRVIQVAPDASQYENIGANETGGAWQREWTAFEHPRLSASSTTPACRSARPSSPAQSFRNRRVGVLCT